MHREPNGYYDPLIPANIAVVEKLRDKSHEIHYYENVPTMMAIEFSSRVPSLLLFTFISSSAPPRCSYQNYTQFDDHSTSHHHHPLIMNGKESSPGSQVIRWFNRPTHRLREHEIPTFLLNIRKLGEIAAYFNSSKIDKNTRGMCTRANTIFCCSELL